MTTPLRAPSAALLASLRANEGLPTPDHGKPALKNYADARVHGAPWTIAYGRAHGVGPHGDLHAGQAEAWLADDAQTAVNAVLAHLPWAAKLDPVRLDVLAEMALIWVGRSWRASAGR